ncbi:hypothetical protein [Clostridium estertheticum]|uniref:hypothetical protein n=1 Tax=Clostridium estertheticum TaxID=238834 RepID=UPI001C7DA742|nr:hypothetical protein [Clostridium estertheticum]MBX4264179.1 hypothetical protein [Clostridium estertheticum]WLC89038.1 hypothetical protein KTC95_02040 [Clostridium estertheticum]
MKPKELTLKVVFKKSEASTQTIFNQIYITDKFRKWFNTFPIWMTFDSKYFDVGCSGTFNLFFPPFKYKMTCVEIIPNKMMKLEFSGWVNGGVTVNFLEDKDNIIMDHPLIIYGRNMFFHLYYSLVLTLPHIPYTRWRFSIMKKIVIQEEKNIVKF